MFFILQWEFSLLPNKLYFDSHANKYKLEIESRNVLHYFSFLIDISFVDFTNPLSLQRENRFQVTKHQAKQE